MRKEKIQDLYPRIEFTQEEFEIALEILPDDISGKPLKASYRKYFNNDGSAKMKKQEGQEWHDVLNFIHLHVMRMVHINRIKNRREIHKKLISESKQKTHKVDRSGKIVERKRNE